MNIITKLVALSAAAAFAMVFSPGSAEAYPPDNGHAALPAATPGFDLAGLDAIAGEGPSASEAGETVELAQRQRRRGARSRSGARSRGEARQRSASPRRSARSRSGSRRSRGRDVGAGVAIGVGAAILGSILAQQGAQAQAHSDAAAFEAEVEDAMYRCDDRFRSFDWDTGTFTTYGGEVRLCPYLEPYVDY